MSDTENNMQSLRKALESIYCKRPETSVSKKSNKLTQSNAGSAETVCKSTSSKTLCKSIISAKTLNTAVIGTEATPNVPEDAVSTDESVELTSPATNKESPYGHIRKPKVSMPKALKFLKKHITTSDSYSLDQGADNISQRYAVAETQLEICPVETVVELHTPKPEIPVKPEIAYHLKPKISGKKIYKFPENTDKITKVESLDEAVGQILICQEVSSSMIPIPPPLPMETHESKKIESEEPKKVVTPKPKNLESILEVPETAVMEPTLLESPSKVSKTHKLREKFRRVKSKDAKRASFKTKRKAKSNIFVVNQKPGASSSQEDQQSGKKMLTFLKKIFKSRHRDE